MKRVLYWKDELNNNKYILRDEYEGFGIYQKKCPTGYFVSQEWMISDNNGHELVISSYNHMCKEELYDMIDNFNECGKYGVKAVRYCGMLCMHNNGKLI